MLSSLKLNYEEFMKFKKSILFSLIISFIGCGQKQLDPNLFSWQPLEVGTKSSLRGISALNENEVWVSGSNGFCSKSIDGGETWETLDVPGTDSLDFRDIHVFEGGITYLMTAGTGESARIYKTEDGGKNWQLQLNNPFAEGFFSCMAFWDSENGIVFSDPVEGKFVFFRTEDGGKDWQQIDPKNIPPAIEGEYAYAASGTCLITQGNNTVFLGTGGTIARVFRSTDKGETWGIAETPFVSGTASSGIFSLAFKDGQTGIAVGGDYQKQNQAKANVAKTTDGGKTWQLVEDSDKLEFRSCVSFLNEPSSNYLITVGRSGCDYSSDNGETWKLFSTTGYYTFDFANSGLFGWAAGSEGRVAKFVF